MVERQRLVSLLSNYACRVVQRGGRRLYFHCNGHGVTLLLLTWAAVASLSVIAFFLMVRLGGNANQGLVGALMGVSIAFWSTRMAIQRYRRHGQFELDSESGVLRRFRAGRLTGEFSLRDVARVSVVFDPSDTVRFRALPSWLQIALRSGEVFRLAKGTRQELAPVCEALRRMGLSPTA